MALIQQMVNWLLDNSHICHRHAPGALVNMMHLEVVWAPEKYFQHRHTSSSATSSPQVYGNVLLDIFVVQLHAQVTASSSVSIGLQGPRHTLLWPVGPSLTAHIRSQQMTNLTPQVWLVGGR